MKKMNDMTPYINILEYLFLSFCIPLLCILLMRKCSFQNNSFMNLFLYAIEGASPSLAVLILWGMKHGKRELISNLLNKYVRHFNLKNCAIGMLIPLIILTSAKGIYILFDQGQPFISIITPKKFLIILWALIAEELGWRGFLQDELEKITSNNVIPLAVGICWAMWHYHFIISGSMSVPIVAFLLGCIFESYGYYAITKISNNNLLPASIWHFTGNLLFNLYHLDPQWHGGKMTAYWIATVMYSLNVLFFVVSSHFYPIKRALYTK